MAKTLIFTGLALNRLSVLRTGNAPAIRFSTRRAISQACGGTRGELLEALSDSKGSPIYLALTLEPY